MPRQIFTAVFRTDPVGLGTLVYSEGAGEDVGKSLKGSTEVRAGILNQFLSGMIAGRDRKSYTELRRPTHYKSRLIPLSFMIDSCGGPSGHQEDGLYLGKLAGVAFSVWLTPTPIRS
jgi:hypothetical protein